jgi:AI-2 transport protein TqsA
VEELVLQRLLQLVADGALRIRAAHVQGHFVHALNLVRDLRAPQDESHLGTVAVPDGQIPPVRDHLRKVVGGIPQCFLLVLHRLVLHIGDQRVAANGDDGDLSLGAHSVCIPIFMSYYTPINPFPATALRGFVAIPRLTAGRRSDGLITMQEAEPSRTVQRLLIAVVVFLTGAALKLAAPVVIVLLLTILLVYLIDPLVVILNNRLKFPLWLSALVAIIVFGAVFAGLGVLIFFDLPHFARTFPKFQEEILRRAQKVLEGLEANYGFTFAVDPFEEIRTLPIRPVLMGLARSSLRFISEFTLIFFFAIILLIGKYRLIHILLTVFPRRHSMVPIMLKHVDRHLRAFLGIKALASLIIGIGTAGILLAFRVEFAVTWGFFTILLNFIPTLGPLTSIALPTLVAAVQYPGFIMPAAIVACLGVLHLGISSFIEPRFLGERLDLSFFVIFLSLFFWGWMWGAAGVLLAVPVTAALKIILERIPATSRVAMLLGRSKRRRVFRPRH